MEPTEVSNASKHNQPYSPPVLRRFGAGWADGKPFEPEEGQATRMGETPFGSFYVRQYDAGPS